MGFQCRYVSALVIFTAAVLLNSDRINLGVTIVAMVNRSSDASQQANNRLHSCPMNINSSEHIADLQIEGDFNWSPKIQGAVLGSNSIGFILTQIVAGKLTEVLGGKRMLLVGTLGVSICTLISPFAARIQVYFFIVLQFMRGIVQGLMLLSLILLMANWYPRNERGQLSAFSLSGLSIGALLGAASSGTLCQSTLFGGWPAVFYVFGSLGILMSVIVGVFLYENPKQHPRISELELKYILGNQECSLSRKRPAAPWKKILSSVPVWALVIAIFGQVWATTHIMTIHSTYLGTILHIPIQQNGIFTALPFALQTFLMWFATWFTNFASKRKYLAINKIRKLWHFTASFGYSACLLAIYASGCNKELNTIFSILGMGISGVGIATIFTVPIDMSPRFVGSVTGFSNFLGCTAGFVLPVLTGFLTNMKETLEQWHKIFFISIAVVMGSSLIFMIWGSAEIQPWNSSTSQDFPQKSLEDFSQNGEKKSESIPKCNSKILTNAT